MGIQNPRILKNHRRVGFLGVFFLKKHIPSTPMNFPSRSGHGHGSERERYTSHRALGWILFGKPMGNLEGWRNLGFHILGAWPMAKTKRVAKIGETTPFMIHSDLYTHFSVVFYWCLWGLLSYWHLNHDHIHCELPVAREKKPDLNIWFEFYLRIVKGVKFCAKITW